MSRRFPTIVGELKSIQGLALVWAHFFRMRTSPMKVVLPHAFRNDLQLPHSIEANRTVANVFAAQLKKR
jgi:hypothetical protein